MKSLLRHPVSVMEWPAIPSPLPGQIAYQHKRSGLTVIESKGVHPNDGREWLHVSCSYSHRLPDWEDLKLVKRVFVGDNRTALQVFPPAREWVNIHPFCLHLWCCLDDEVVPAFAVNGSI